MKSTTHINAKIDTNLTTIYENIELQKIEKKIIWGYS